MDETEVISEETEEMSEEELAQTLESIDEINLQELEAEIAPILDTLPAAEPVAEEPELEVVEPELEAALSELEEELPVLEEVTLPELEEVLPEPDVELPELEEAILPETDVLEEVADDDPMLAAAAEMDEADPMLEAVVDVDPMLEVEIEAAPEVAETMLEAMTELDQVLEPDPMREPDPTFNPDPEPEFIPEPEPEPELIQEIEPEVEYEPEPEPEPEPLPPAKSKVDCVETETSDLANNIRYKMSIIETISHLLAGAGTEVVEAVSQAIGSESALPLESTSAYESKVDAIEESIAEFADSIRKDLKVMEAISKLLSGAGEDGTPSGSQSKSKKSVK